MSRSFERKIIYVASAWQIITGFITMFFYSTFIKKQGVEASLGNTQFVERKGIESLFDSLYTYTVTYGLFFILIGGLNIFFVRKILKDNTLQYKLPLYWIVLAVICYFLSDFISISFLIITAVIVLAKNKPIKAAQVKEDQLDDSI